MLRIITVISGVLAVLPAARADGCFCLLDASTQNVQRGCETRNNVILCTDPVTGKISKGGTSPSWTRLEEGAEFCKVCRPPKPGGKIEVPRGDNDKAGQPK